MNREHAEAVAEIESITRDYCATASKLPIVDEWDTPVDRACHMTMLADARTFLVDTYQIARNFPVKHVSEQTTWSQMTHDQRAAHLTLFFNLPLSIRGTR